MREGTVSNRGAGGAHLGSVWVVGGAAPPQLWSWQCLINELITAAERTEVRYAELLEGGTVVKPRERIRSGGGEVLQGLIVDSS